MIKVKAYIKTNGRAMLALLLVGFAGGKLTNAAAEVEVPVVAEFAIAGTAEVQVICVNGVPVCASLPQAATPTAQAASPSATRTAAPQSTATPTRTPQPTPSHLPPGTPITGTNIPATPFCAWEMDGAQDAKKVTWYTYTDPLNSGLYQRIRGGPGIEFLTLKYLSRLERRQVYWSIVRGGYTWWALDVTCHEWVAQLGGIEIILD